MSSWLHFGKRLVSFLNVMVLLCSIAIIGDVSYKILTFDAYDPTDAITLKLQLVVCVIFMLDFLVRLLVDQDKWSFFKKNFLLLLFSIPYLNLVHHYGVDLSVQGHFLLGLVPLLRSGFGLVIIVKWITKRSASSLMFSYLIILLSVSYFSSLLFFVSERGVNSEVHTFWDALWWATMDMTTVGSNIIAVTPIGKVLSVFLAAGGMMMLPIFTVYINDKLVTSRKKEDKNSSQDNSATNN